MAGAAAGRVAEVDKHAAEQCHPEAQGVQAREGHVPRPDHERHQVVGHADEDRHAHEEDHCRAVHCKQAG